MKRFLRINRMALGETRTHTKFIVIVNILLGFGCLLLSLEKSYIDLLHADWMVFGYLLFAVGGIIGTMAVIGVFRDLNSIQYSDVQMSLPMSSAQRYFSKLLALFYLHIFPVLFWGGLTVVIKTIEKHNSEVYRFFWTTGDWDFFWYESVDWFRLYLCFAASVLFLDAVGVLCAVCCGRRAETGYFSYIAAYCLSVLPLLIRNRLLQTWGGQTMEPGHAFFVWTWSFWVKTYTDFPTYLLLINCGISIALMVLMYFVYRRRDAGTAGRPVSNRVFFEGVMFAAVLTMLSLNGSRYGILLTITGIAYLVIHIITFREQLSCRKIAVWLGKYAVTVLLVFLLNFAAYMTNGFGAVYYIPSESLDGAHVVVTTNRTTGSVVFYAGSGLAIYNESMEAYDGYVAPISMSDALKRDAIRIVQRHLAAQEKSFTDFFQRLGLIETEENWRRDLVNITVFQTKTGPDQEVMTQSLFLPYHEINAMAEELEDSGLVRAMEDLWYDSYAHQFHR